ncbi:MAG: CHAT domain-containing protein [Zoogloeaceae bacterium]|nr:CHAT domain-containing protein [Zoogloeaceae bacterium]
MAPRSAPATAGVRFVDFAIRAWRSDARHVSVIAHATPLGSVRHPIQVNLPRVERADLEIGFDYSLERAAEVGRKLAGVLLPEPIGGLFLESIRWAASQPAVGLRIRLCLDEELIDLPWECLYRPDLPGPAVPSGFFLADGDLALVREAPGQPLAAEASDAVQRLLFLGTLFDHPDTPDLWFVEEEFRLLSAHVAALGSRIRLDFLPTSSADQVESQLATPIDIFHYAGHVEAEDAEAHFLQLAHWDDAQGTFYEVQPQPSPWTRAHQLAPRLKAAGTRLAVFNACNSGHWPFVQPFMEAGLPALIGVQGNVTNDAALVFSSELYGALAAGLSLDEASTQARLGVLDLALKDPADRPASNRQIQVSANDWLRFMVYMPVAEAVLFPRTDRPAAGREKRAARARRTDRLETLYATLTKLDDAEQSRVISQIYRSRVLILGRFDAAHKPTLDALGRALDAHPAGYRKHLFDYEPPPGRNLTEWVRHHVLTSRFVIADLTDPRSVPYELGSVVPTSPSVPFVPIIREGAPPFAMAADLKVYPWVLPTVTYRDDADLIARLDGEVIAPAEARLAAGGTH